VSFLEGVQDPLDAIVGMRSDRCLEDGRHLWGGALWSKSHLQSCRLVTVSLPPQAQWELGVANGSLFSTARVISRWGGDGASRLSKQPGRFLARLAKGRQGRIASSAVVVGVRLQWHGHRQGSGGLVGRRHDGSAFARQSWFKRSC